MEISNEKKINVDLNDKYFCYLLGLIWSDGHVDKKSNRVLISLKEDDMNNIKYIFDKTAKWNTTYCDNSKRGYKNQLRFDISDKIFHDFLTHHYFLNKSIESPDLLVEKIKRENLKYFIRGVIDGDGCFYYNKKNYTRQLVITSTYEQNWNYLINYFQLIGCKYEIRRINNNKSKSSLIRVTNKDIIKFGESIYEDFFGLNRKYENYKTIKESYLENPYKNRKIRTKKIIIEGKEFQSMLDASVYFGLNRNILRKKLLSGFYQSNYCDCKMT
jgi:hypothetical protein